MYRIIPLNLPRANSLVTLWHRHHKSVRGHRFSIGCVDIKTGELVGAAIVGRPVSRNINPDTTLEVLRLVTNGAKNACSILYSAAARVGKEMGYERIQTYILEEELGTSLKASGWEYDGVGFGGGTWRQQLGGQIKVDYPTGKKQRWSKRLN